MDDLFNFKLEVSTEERKQYVIEVDRATNMYICYTRLPVPWKMYQITFGAGTNKYGADFKKFINITNRDDVKRLSKTMRAILVHFIDNFSVDGFLTAVASTDKRLGFVRNNERVVGFTNVLEERSSKGAFIRLSCRKDLDIEKVRPSMSVIKEAVGLS